MNTIKGFASHSRFIDNDDFKVHQFGEISTQSETYEKDVGKFQNSNDRAIMLYLFKSLDGKTRKVISQANLDFSQEVVKATYDYLLASAREYLPSDLEKHLLTTFRDKGSHFVSGPLSGDGMFYCPQWISFKDIAGNEYRWWFSDEAFQNEYDDFEIMIIPPVDNMEVFFMTPARIIEELEKTPFEQLTRKADAARSRYPVTYFRSPMYMWNNPKTLKPEIETNWYILGWGLAGDNIDDINQALEDFILKHPTNKHTRDEWAIRFPDIFRKSEFVIIPQWDVYSQSNKVKEQASLYSPFSNHKDIIPKYMEKFAINYKKKHLQDNTQVTGVYFRSITVFSCGSDENREGKFSLQSLYPDYINVPSTQPDYNYQSKNTQIFSEMLNDMLAIAEHMTQFNPLPREQIKLPNGETVSGERIYTRTIRDGKIYLVKKLNGFNFLVLAKESMVPKK